MGGNAQSVKLHPPTHPLQLTSPGILATPGHHNASDNLCFSSGILATPDYHNASFIRCFSSGIQATPDYHKACSDFLSGIQATPDYHNAWKVSLSCWPLKSDCLTQPSETTLFRPMPKKMRVDLSSDVWVNGYLMSLAFWYFSGKLRPRRPVRPL